MNKKLKRQPRRVISNSNKENRPMNVHRPELQKRDKELEYEYHQRVISFGTIVGVIGAILVALGVIWMIGANWHSIPAAVKIGLLLIAIASAYASGTVLKVKGYFGISKALIALGALLYTASIFLIAQIFATGTGLQGMAFLFLLAWVGVVAASYAFDSPISLIIALIEFLVWIVLQYFVLFEGRYGANSSFASVSLIFLGVGILIYGLTLIHRYLNHKFSKVYFWWSAFYFLLFSSILTSRIVLQMLKGGLFVFNSTGPFIFLFIFFIISIFIFVLGAMMALKKKVNPKEVYGVGLLLCLLTLLILSTYLLPGNENSFYRAYDASLSPALLIVWSFSNIILILFILAVIGYGTWQKNPGLVNLGIAFFVIDIISRYIGFVAYFQGYLSMSLIFIMGGLLLIVGGFLIEKWRRKLIARAEGKETRNTPA